MSFDPRALLSQVQDIVLASGRIVRERHAKPRNVRRKGRIDLVTDTDEAVEEFLKERLKDCLPGSVFLAEESAGTAWDFLEDARLAAGTPRDFSFFSTGEAVASPAGAGASAIPGKESPCWIIDPVDGTTNFAHGLCLVGTSVGLWHKGEMLLGVVNLPLAGECFTAAKGQGAFCNALPIRVSAAADLNDALVATGFPYSIEEDLEAVLSRLRRVLPRVQGVRRCGAASVDLAWLAAGRFDAFYEDRLKPWDAAAGWLLVEEAGGRLSAFDGSPFSLARGEVLASNGLMHEAMTDLLSG